MNNNSKKVQDWIPLKKILENGIIITKNDTYVKILKILPINYNLKTEFEKEQILNSYKVFLKTCNFNIQILIQSKKEDLSLNIQNIQNKIEKENSNIKEIGKNYIKYITKINKENQSSSKNFYILIKNSKLNVNPENKTEIIFEELNEKYLKIKDTLNRCR